MCTLCSSNPLNAVDGTHGLVGDVAGDLGIPSVLDPGVDADAMTIGTTVGGSFADGKTDLYELDMDAGDAIAVDLVGLNAGEGATVSLYDGNGRLMGVHEDGDTLNFIADTDGPVFIRVDTGAAPGTQQAQDYELQVAEANSSGHANLTTLANFLTNGYWSTPMKWNLGDSGYMAKNGQLTFNVSGISGDSNGLTNDRKELVREAFKIYEEVLGIDFVETQSTTADFRFMDNKSGAYASSSYGIVGGQGYISYSTINVQQSWYGSSSAVDGYTFQTILHEIGHALGLGHQGSYNGSANYGTSNDFANDSWQGTMMSYFSQTENTSIDASYAFLLSPMAVDWIALDSLYGEYGFTSANAFDGDTVYGFNTNISSSVSDIWANLSTYADTMAFTIVDGGGTDTVDFSGYYQNQRIDLTVTEGSFTQATTSDIGTETGNMTLAVGTVIENAIGGTGNDQLIGNYVDNTLNGGDGNDELTGGDGDDHLIGGQGDDVAVFTGTYADYTFASGSGYWQVTGEGVDRVYDDVETLRFADQDVAYGDITGSGPAPGPEDDPAPAIVDPDARDDALTVAEDGTASIDLFADNGSGADAHADGTAFTITELAGATSGPVTLTSGAVVTFTANGTLSFDTNGAYNSLAVGQTATETISYTIATADGGTDTATVTVTITGTNDGPVAVADTFTVVEDGLLAANVLTGDGADTDVDGDTLTVISVNGAGMGPVTLASGAVVEIASNGALTLTQNDAYDALSDGQTAQETVTYTVSDGNGGTDTATVTITIDGQDLILTQTGTAERDRLTGTEYGDTLSGLDDHDTLFGMGADDMLYGDAGKDRLFGGDGADMLDGGANDDRIYGEAGADELLGGLGRDRLYGGDGADVLNGGEGNDQLRGGAGNDTLTDTQGKSNQMRGGDGDDVLTSGDDRGQLRGDAGDDLLYGNGGRDQLNGGAGNDELYGGDDKDQLVGRDGEDLLFGGDGRDNMNGGRDNDELYGGEGDDQMKGDKGDDLLVGAEGNDRLAGGAGDDQLYAGAGDNRLAGGSGNDTMIAEDGMDRLDGGAGDDYIVAAGGNDRLKGGAGNDQLFAGAGDDDMRGGKGDDVFYGGDGADLMRGDAGIDIAWYADATEGFTASLADARLNTGVATGDTYRKMEGFVGSGHADTLGGDDEDNVFTGGSGADTFVFTHASFGAEFGADTVTDWEDGTDLLDFSAAGLGFADFTVTTEGDNILLILTDDPDHMVTLQGAAGATIGANDFI